MAAGFSHRPPVIDADLLALLLNAAGPTSIEAIALQRGITRAAVQAELQRLRDAGCTFNEHPQHGIELVRTGLGVWSDYLEHLTSPSRIIEVYRSTASTQDICRRIVETHGHASAAALAVAEQQTAGRGRLGRQWFAPAGTAITFSRVKLLPAEQQDSVVDRLTLATSVAVAEAVQALLGEQHTVTLKWPNDVYIAGKKIAGILVESFRSATGVRAAIVGVGVNVSLLPEHLPEDQPELRARITSLAMLGCKLDLLPVLGDVVLRMDKALDHANIDTLLQEWRRRSLMLHQPIKVRSNGQLIAGQVIDLDASEGLIVRTDAGQIVHLPAATTTVVS